MFSSVHMLVGADKQNSKQLTKQSYSLPSRAFDRTVEKNPYTVCEYIYHMHVYMYIYIQKFNFISICIYRIYVLLYVAMLPSFHCVFQKDFPQFMKADAIYIFCLFTTQPPRYISHEISRGHDIFFST